MNSCPSTAAIRTQIFDIDGLREQKPVFWSHPCPLEKSSSEHHNAEISVAAVETASVRFSRFKPVLATLCKELKESGGEIESPLIAVPRLQSELGIGTEHGRLLVKADHMLPMAGSVKARGGTHEIIEFAERLAMEKGLITLSSDYQLLTSPQARSLFSKYTISVGSTGNLGLAIGTLAAALGFNAEVHMSSDAKAWKKERLRINGVHVIEHAGDYAKAVAAGRSAAQENPLCHFVDDERSSSLFLGYATAAAHLKKQLEQAQISVDASHPLFVYLPCGVGGAPSGITYGLHQIYGDNVHCIFAEPTASPCFLVQMLAQTKGLQNIHDNPTVYDVGLDNITEADGLAVPQASELAATVVGDMIAGIYTVRDETLFHHLHLAHTTHNLELEPSAAAGLSGPEMLLKTSHGMDYLRQKDLLPHLKNSTHIAWLTGGSLVPPSEYQKFLSNGENLSKILQACSKQHD
jgi:D-serine dehydratase